MSFKIHDINEILNEEEVLPAERHQRKYKKVLPVFTTAHQNRQQDMELQIDIKWLKCDNEDNYKAEVF